MLELFLPPACVACRRLLRDDASRGLCRACNLEVVPTRGDALAPFTHEGPLRRALSALKYDGDLARAGPLGRLLRPSLGARTFDLAAAVPLHPRRQRSRGFNQSELLLRAGLGASRPTRLLKRTRATDPQVGLPARRRHENVAGAFALHPQVRLDLRGRRVLLFDDVCTTGATLQAAAVPLQAAGATVTFLALLQAVA